MANTPQAKKRIRRNDRRAEINGNRVSRIRTFMKKVESAIAAGDKGAATTAALAAAQPELARGVAKGVLPQEHCVAQVRAPDQGRHRTRLSLYGFAINARRDLSRRAFCRPRSYSIASVRGSKTCCDAPGNRLTEHK
jgi:small subunit ribosomal protein S20